MAENFKRFLSKLKFWETNFQPSDKPYSFQLLIGPDMQAQGVLLLAPQLQVHLLWQYPELNLLTKPKNMLWVIFELLEKGLLKAS